MRRARTLVLAHWSTVATLPATLGAGPDEPVDVLVAGRSGAAQPLPEGLRAVEAPGGAGAVGRVVAAARLVRRLRAAGYERYVLSVPPGPRARHRGALGAVGLLAGAGRMAVVDGERVVERALSRPRAAADLAGWALGRAACVPAAALAATVLDRVPARPEALRPLAGGRVLYLRTDHDLADGGLESGGSVAHTDGVVRALRATGHEVELWSTGHLGGLPADLPGGRLRVVRTANLPVEVVELLSGLVQARDLLRRPSPPPDLVYQRHSLLNLAGPLAARRWGVPLVLEANAVEADWRARWGTLGHGRLARAAERFALRSAARVLAVSDVVADDLAAAGAPRAHVRVVPNAVDATRFGTAEPEALPVPAGAVVVAFAGLFYPWHGVPLLAEAFARLHARRPSARLLLVGDGEDAAVALDVLRRAGDADAVVATGLVTRERVPGLLAAADVLVSPHAPAERFIGSPIKLFEYMAAGRAIVASRLGQIGDVLEDERTALLVPPGDVAALAAALERLHDDGALRARLGAAARAEAVARHGWEARVRDALDPAAGP